MKLFSRKLCVYCITHEKYCKEKKKKRGLSSTNEKRLDKTELRTHVAWCFFFSFSF